MTTIDEIVENFALLDEWDDRYRYVIELGRTLSPLPDSGHVDANKVQGCASQVWLLTHVKPIGSSGPILTFEGDSDAHIVRGLIAILFALYSGRTRKTFWQPTRLRSLTVSVYAKTSRRSARTVCAPWWSVSAPKRKRH
jgi:sulfur transfer protein SufE